MSEDFDNKMDQFKELLENDKMADTIKMIMGMLEKNKKFNDKPLTASNNTENSLSNNRPPTKEPPQSNFTNNPSIDQSMDMVMKIKNIYDKVNAGDDSRVNLLMAIKPYLSDERRTHIDTAIKLVNVSKISTILSEVDII